MLSIRAKQPYPGKLQQVLILDELDSETQLLCNKLMEKFPEWQPEIIKIKSDTGIASKPNKLLSGLKVATGEVLCFIDDDILLRNDTLQTLVYNLKPGIGSTFGLACYTNWKNFWSGLMSAFVNANALLNYIPLANLLDPYSITGHIYAIKRIDFEFVGGFKDMESRLDDDHELARRIMASGLKNKQTSALYDVDNYLPSMQWFFNQMKRWFIFPREMMLPEVSLVSKILTLITSLPSLLPGIIILLTLGNIQAWPYLVIVIIISYLIYFLGTRYYLHTTSPQWVVPLIIIVTFIIPFQILFFLFSDNSITWRGQKLRIQKGGKYEINQQ